MARKLTRAKLDAKRFRAFKKAMAKRARVLGLLKSKTPRFNPPIKGWMRAKKVRIRKTAGGYRVDVKR